MARRLARILLLALVLTLAACYRPAGEAIEPTPNTGQPVVPANDNGGDATEEMPVFGDIVEPITGNTEETSGGLSDDNLPPITVIVPTRPVQTQAPSGSTFTTNSTAIPGTTPTYITPGVPLGLIPDPTATPTGGAFTATPSGLVTPTDMNAGLDSACLYTVQPGDYLYRIATDHDIALEDLRAANPDLVGDAPILQVGQQLNLPCNTPQPEPQEIILPTDIPPTVIPGGEVYTVQSGDTVAIIAQRYGVTIEAIVAANNLANPDRLDIGDQLVIPPPAG